MYARSLFFPSYQLTGINIKSSLFLYSVNHFSLFSYFFFLKKKAL